MKYLILLLLLVGCKEEVQRGYINVECYDKQDKLVLKHRTQEFYIQGSEIGKPGNMHSCYVVGEQ